MPRPPFPPGPPHSFHRCESSTQSRKSLSLFLALVCFMPPTKHRIFPRIIPKNIPKAGLSIWDKISRYTPYFFHS